MPSKPRYVAIEGALATGKTALARSLGGALKSRLILETFEDNPFLGAFYADRSANALAAQLFFLMARFQRHRPLAQQELFRAYTISDGLFAKDWIYASINLGPEELRLYEELYSVLVLQVPPPDLVIYLRPSFDALSARVQSRDRTLERNLDRAYLRSLFDAYELFFAQYREAPVLTLDPDQVDVEGEGPDRDALLSVVRSARIPERWQTARLRGGLFDLGEPADLDG